MKTLIRFMVVSLALALTFNAASAQENVELLDIQFNLADIRVLSSQPVANLPSPADTSSTAQEQTNYRVNRLIGHVEVRRAVQKVLTNVDMVDPNADHNAIYIYPGQRVEFNDDRQVKILGFSAKQALLASRDPYSTSGCSRGHEQGDLANRWCHAAIARTFAMTLEQHGVDPKLATVFGGMFWMPKEFFMDMNPSMHDLVMTYKDRLGRIRGATFEVSAFADGAFVLTLTKKLGGSR